MSSTTDRSSCERVSTTSDGPHAVRTLLLARHARAESNRRGGTASSAVPGEGLTPEGVKQARRLAAALAAEDVDLGVATRFRRTQETLELALEGRDIPTIVVPELDEIGFGSFDGGSLENYRAWAFSASPTVSAPGGGESRAHAAARYAEGLRSLLGRKEPNVLLVGHALALRYVLDAARGLMPAARMAPVEHGTLQRLDTHVLHAAADRLEDWSRAPSFRDPSIEGWASMEPGRPSRG
jgi:broad specificity phosphatase PhoE